MKLRHTSLLTAILALPLPLFAVEQQDLVGTWYSEREDSGERLKRLIRRDADNNYAELLLICDGMNVSWVQKELGHWHISADNAFDVVMISREDMHGKKSADPAHATARYINVEREGNHLTYEQRDKGNKFRFERVDDGYQIRCE